MDSEQFGQISHSIGSALKCCSSPLRQQLSLQLQHELLHADYEIDVIANIRLPQCQLSEEQQQKDADSNASSPCVVRSSYVGVDKVPGRTRWPYRAVLSLPSWAPFPSNASHDTVLCESYYSTPEAAARAVDTICMVLLGRQAAVNFPASSYDDTDLEDASKYIQCISGAAFGSSSSSSSSSSGSCGCAGVRIGEL